MAPAMPKQPLHSPQWDERSIRSIRWRIISGRVSICAKALRGQTMNFYAQMRKQVGEEQRALISPLIRSHARILSSCLGTCQLSLSSESGLHCFRRGGAYRRFSNRLGRGGV